MKNIIFALIFIFSIIFSGVQAQKTLHDFTVKDIENNDFDFSTLKGKKVLIVNTASKCGFTPQYKELQALYLKYIDNNFVIVGFPANNFLKQEPGSNEEIKDFCERNYGVSFPMMAKVSVKGKDIAPIFEWLTKKELNGLKDITITWNFQKFMIDENGMLVDYLPPKESCLSDKVINWITQQ